jgi:hypothetical protein
MWDCNAIHACNGVADGLFLFSMSAVIGMIVQDSKRAIDLFCQHNSRQFMWQGDFPQ